MLYVAAAGLALSGCSRGYTWYPVPEQREPILQRRITMIAMNDPDAGEYILKDIAPNLEDGFWRWTYDRPELEIWLKQARNVHVTMEFIIADATFTKTGPVTVTMFVNGHPAVSKKYDAAGRYTLSTPVPDGWLDAPGPARLAAEARPIWIAAKDGQHLGIVLIRAGFL